MKKFSNYYKTMMITAIILGLIACVVPSTTMSVVLFVFAFIIWYAGIIAPDYEKYKLYSSDKDAPVRNTYNEYTPEQVELKKRLRLVDELCDNKFDQLEVLERLKVQMIRKNKFDLAEMIENEMGLVKIA